MRYCVTITLDDDSVIDVYIKNTSDEHIRNFTYDIIKNGYAGKPSGYDCFIGIPARRIMRVDAFRQEERRGNA